MSLAGLASVVRLALETLGANARATVKVTAGGDLFIGPAAPPTPAGAGG